MAEPVYKKITELDVLSGALDGNETLPVVKSGKTYKRSWANFFGTGWITSLLGAFTAFKAPDADHADDADTVGGETAAQLHAAASLTGAIHLDRIPAELTGKNAATATVSAACSGNAATASACSGNAATATISDALKGCDIYAGVPPRIPGLPSESWLYLGFGGGGQLVGYGGGAGGTELPASHTVVFGMRYL